MKQSTQIEHFYIKKEIVINSSCFTFVAELDPSHLSFSSKSTSKKKRKSRTAFTNHQIFELEKRFLYQKYLSPADRDEIAAQLGLSNAQVGAKSNLQLTRPPGPAAEIAFCKVRQGAPLNISGLQNVSV